MKPHTILPLLFTLLAFCMPVKAEELTPEKRGDIEHLLAMTGAMSLGKQMAANVVASLTHGLQSNRPDIPKDVINLLPEAVGSVFDENLEALKNEVIPIYHKHFTREEIQEMIRFYATPLGQKSIRVMPVLMQDSMMAGQRWGEMLGPKIEKKITTKLREHGVKI